MGSIYFMEIKTYMNKKNSVILSEEIDYELKIHSEFINQFEEHELPLK